jgi:hypothetical protein
MWGALAKYRSVTSDINASILFSRFRALFAFMTTPIVQSAVDWLHARWYQDRPSPHRIFAAAMWSSKTSDFSSRMIEDKQMETAVPMCKG